MQLVRVLGNDASPSLSSKVNTSNTYVLPGWI